ncbi:MAG TPA: sigma-70 family RNA polymerase sigma factor [Trebonia sp.]|nr:sigma-70 family RNA polymerase sigma factor [Trebonia sp.]
MLDSEVVASIVAGDPDGLAAAYDKYANPLYAYCRTMLKDPADAADAVQDTFVIAASRLDGLRDAGRLRPWLYAVARNECLRILRAKKNTSALDEVPDVTDESADVSGDAERTELRTLLTDAAGGLNPGEREVIELQLRQGLEPAEVAAVLGVSRNHAHSLLSRARDQLEACLAVLLVGRAGQDDCDELGTMLLGWDGRLTVLLRKRVNRHIEHCATCTSRRAFELRPAMFLGLSPLAAMAAAAAESLHLAPAVPAAIKGHVLALATGTGPAAAAHRAAVLSRAGAFGRHGFPRALHAGGAAHGPVAAKGSAFIKTPQGQAAVAAVVLAMIIASVAFALTGNTEHLSLAGGKPAHHGGGGGAPAAPPAAGGHQGNPPPPKPEPKPRQPNPARPAPPATTATAPRPAPSRQPPRTARPPAPAPARTTPAAPATRATTPPAPTPAPTTPTPTPAPTTPAPPPALGTLAVIPDGGQMYADTTPLVLFAHAGTVSWSISVSGGNGQINVFPAAGTLRPGLPAVVSVTASPFYAGTAVLTISPGQTRITVRSWNWSRPGSPLSSLLSP